MHMITNKEKTMTTETTEARAEFVHILSAFDATRAARDTKRAMWLHDLYDVRAGREPLTILQRRRKTDRALIEQEHDARMTQSIAASLALAFSQARLRDGLNSI